MAKGIATFLYGKPSSLPTRKQPCLKPISGVIFTCHALYPPDGTWRGRPPGEHSRLGQVWTQSACSAHRCDTAGRSESAAHQKRSDCHPKARGSEKDGLSPERITTRPLPRTTTIIIPVKTGMLAHVSEPSSQEAGEGGLKFEAIPGKTEAPCL